MKKILMIAFHYPPLHGSSGIQRTLRFSHYLPDYGWQPIVLTAHPRAYPQIETGQLREIHAEVLVERAFALDTARHLSIHNFYFRWMALPDRWISWWPGAVMTGLRLIRKYRPHIIWSTFPIATAHLIGLALHRCTGIPWIADCRDPLTDTDPLTGVEYPLDPSVRKVNSWIERPTINSCVQAVFTTPSTLDMYAERYPEIPQSRWSLIANGYDEENFTAVEQGVTGRPAPHQPIVIVHSGLLEISARDPRVFFAAIGELKRAGKISPGHLKIILRASGSEDLYRQYLRENCIEDIIFLEAFIPYRAALAEMLHADGLLIFQASSCNYQIPAKLYEYLRARRPILALTDPKGDTARVLRATGIDTIIPLDSKEQIVQGLPRFLSQVHEGHAPIASDSEIEKHSRRSRTQELARLLDSSISTKNSTTLESL